MAERLRVNPIQCVGHGVCAELLPELIAVDEWGYPLIDPRPVPGALERGARRAVSACPARGWWRAKRGIPAVLAHELCPLDRN